MEYSLWQNPSCTGAFSSINFKQSGAEINSNYRLEVNLGIGAIYSMYLCAITNGKIKAAVKINYQICADDAITEKSGVNDSLKKWAFVNQTAG